MSTFPLGRIAGLSIRVHASWAIILALIVVTVAAQVGSLDPGTSQPMRWGIGVAVAVAFLLSAVAHELAHALVARRRGVPTTTIVVYFLGASATPALETTRPRDEIMTALAGPLASIALGAVLLGVAAAVESTDTSLAMAVGSTALVVGTLDVALGLLNLLPAYPLDGGRVVRAMAWSRTGDPRAALRTAASVGRAVGLTIAVLGVMGIFLIDSIDGLMIALGGWFLTSTARGVERRASLDSVLDGLFVRDVMERDVTTIPPGLTIDTFASQVLGGSAALALPVVRGSELLGLIGARQLRGIRQDRWATVRVEDVMVTGSALPILGPGATVQSAIDDLARSSLDGLPVVEDGLLTGMVMRRAIADAIRVRAASAGLAGW